MDNNNATISFGGSGLLLTYHAGVAQQLLHLPWSQFSGVSGGAVIALLMCVAPERLGEAIDIVLKKEWAQGLTWGDLWDPA